MIHNKSFHITFEVKTVLGKPSFEIIATFIVPKFNSDTITHLKLNETQKVFPISPYIFQ